MPGEQPRRPPPPTTTGDLPPYRVASSLGHPSQPPCENPAVASGTTQGARDAGSRTRATEPRKAQPRQAGEVEAKALLLSAQNLGSTPGKRGSPQAPVARSHAQTHLRLAGKVGSSPQQHCSLSIVNSRAETPKDPHREVPESPGPAPHLRPSLVSAGAPPAPEELSFQRCFQGDPSVCTSTDGTSLATTPGSPPLRDPRGHGASPHRPASYPTFQAGQADSWTPAAGSSFPGANLGVSPGEPEPFPKGNRPGGSPRGVSFQFPFPELHGAGAKPFPAEMAMSEHTEGTLVLAFHQATGVWPDGALGTGPACPPPTQPAPPLPWYPGQPGGLDGTLPPPSAAPPSPFSDSLHESLTKVLPERPPSTCSRMGSPGGTPNPLPQRHLLGPAYRLSGVGTSLGPLDPELATPGPMAVRLSKLWDPPAASYPKPPLGAPATARNMFSDRQPSPGRQLCLPQGLSLPWPQGLPTRGPGPHQMDTMSQLSFPAGTPEWQGACQGTLGAGEVLADMRKGPGQSAGTPGLFTHTALKDPGTQPLFRVAQPQVSPRGTPRVVGASPRESPLPSPATSTASSSACSSLSPLSSSPANPSSEEGQLPGPLVPSAFFHAPTHSQETGSPFQSPAPSHYQPEPVKTFRFPVDGLVAEGSLQGLDEVGGAGPPPYMAAHFPLSSASLDQLDVLLTCRQCDRTYGSLAAFLAHRQFCGLLLARAKDGPPRLPDAPGARAHIHAGPLSQAKMAPFPAAGGTQGDGRDDPLRTSLLPSLAAPFPLPASDLDPEDDAKLDSLITEALNGMEHQPGSLEIDSSFIDVFTDEEPSGPRGPGPGQLPKARAGATAEGRGQAPVTAAGLEPQTSYAGDKGCPARSRPKTRSLGPVPMAGGGPPPNGTQESQDLSRLLPRGQRGGLVLEPGTVDRPYPDPHVLVALGSPAAHLASDLVLRSNVTPLHGASHSRASQGRAADTAGAPSGAGLPHPAAERPGSEGGVLTATGPSWTTARQGGEAHSIPAPSRTCVPDVGPGRGPQDPALSPLRHPQLLGAGSAKNESDTQELPPPKVQSLPPGAPSGLAGGLREGGDVALSPAQDSSGGVQVTAAFAMARRWPGPEADGPLGLCGLAEGPEGQGHASWLQPESQGSPGGQAVVGTDPAATPARPARSADVLEEERGGSGATSSPTTPERESWLLASAAHPTDGPVGSPTEMVPGPGPGSLLLPQEGPAPAPGSLGPCVPLPTTVVTQGDPPTVPSEATGAPGKLRRPLPTSLSYRDSPSALHLLPCPFTWAPPEGGLEAFPCLTANPCDPEEVVAHNLATGDGCPLEDPPTCQPGFIEALKPTCREASPKEGTLRTQEGSRKERPRRGPAAAAPTPVGGRPSRAAAGLPTLPANEETETAKGPRGPRPPRTGSLPPSPDGVPKDPSDLPSNTGHLGPRDSHSVTDLTTPGATEPDSHTCPEGEAGPSSEGREHPGMPGLAKVPRVGSKGRTVTCPSARLRLDPDVSRDALRCMPRRNPRGPRDPQQRPHGFTKKLLSTEKGRAPDGLPATCDVCAASFRSRPGLSRHKARKHRLQPLPDLPAPQPSEPKAQLCQPPGVDHQVPGRERPAHSPIQDPSHAAEDAPESEAWVEGRQGLGVPGTRGSPPSQQPDPHGRTRRELGMNAAASVPRRPAQPRTERAAQREGPQRGNRPVDCSSDAEGPNGKRGRLRARRARARPAPRVSPDAISDRRGSGPSTAIANYPAPPSRCLSLSPEGEPGAHVGPREVEGAAEMGPGAPCAEETQAQEVPGDGRIHPGRMEGASPREWPAEQRGASASGVQGPRDSAPGTYKQLSWAAGSITTEDSTGTESEPGNSLEEERVPPLGPMGPPESSGSEAASTFSSCAQGVLHSPEALAGVQGPEGAAPRPPGSGLGDPLSLFDDEVSFSQLFPLGGRLTRKKNPRVYGKRYRKPKRQPLPEPCSEAGDSAVQPSACLPMDLSDSGSLCLSQEDPWDDEATGLPESFLLDGLLSGKLPGMTPWAPCSSPWVPEPTKETSRAEGVLSHYAEAGPESIPELHVVPAAWRGLELRAPAVEAPHSLGDVSPEPPNLEREHYDRGLPTGASPMPFHTPDFEVLGPKVPVQDLCLLGACEDLAGAPSTSCFDLKAMGSPQGPQGRTEEASRPKRAEGRDQATKGRKAPYKCRVCFQRFHGLAERDAHRLAHSPSPPPTCYMCVQRRFGSRELLREHLQEKHAQGRPGLWACGMCLKEVADVWMYNEHLREHATRFARRAPTWGPPGGLAPLPTRLRTPARPLNGITGQTSRPHRCKHPKGGASGSPTKLSQPEGNAEEETPGEGMRPMVRPAPPGHDAAACVPDGSPAGVPASSPAALSGSPNPSPDAWCGSEPLLQAAQVHEDCKDPSRDCHHCGKRFPKPFKLQRHLAVHSPQRVYLCPRCPRVYPEHRELRAHLGGAHGVVEGPEPQHTPLYACELCANVMHVIRRSFACSSCNYTFAKKEQFDRHMDKHPRSGRQPFTFRGVRRPGVPGQRAPTPEGILPSKQPRLLAPGSTLEPQACGPLQGSSPTLSEGAPPALPQLCVDVIPSEPEGRPATQESPRGGPQPTEPARLAVRGPGPPPDLGDLPAQSLSPSPTAKADGKGGSKVGGAALQHTVPPQALPGTGAQDVADRKAQHLASRKHRPLVAHGHSPEGMLLLQEEKQVSSSHVVLGGTWGGPSHKHSASTPGNCWSSSKDRPTPDTLPEQLRVAVGSLAPGTPPPPRGAEHRTKPPTPKGRAGPSSRSTKAVGDVRPQPASRQLQREAATMPAKATSPGRSPPAGKPLSRALTKTSRGSPGPSQRAEGSEERSKGLAPGPAGGDSPDKRPRPPRKQAMPSRVLPAKPRPGSQHSRTKLRPSEQRRGAPGHTHGKEGLGEPFPRVRPLLRPPRRGRASQGPQPAHARDCRTAASQNDLLNQLFGPRLTGFRIPLKKDASE
ncbi:Zinc finger protein 469 [Tupaia chinensis]|uniref:Zinc finger protein 469 n=1 Tax=Tupaia chinensis TaxID=246437 RepID=L9KNZ9_TUPCH|nr:Zinc finger protein 469 [Tupaia chinensis]